MCLKVIQTVLCYFAYILAFEDVICVYGQGSQEILEQGRAQYQLLQERGGLPQYGNCWKDAIMHIDEGCRTLSEDTQAEIALHLTNCFLAMSGHDTYECELNKKPNLRAICINTMSDRAFNVYTEFYTQTQNICWFLRGQIWQETIAENTWKVGKQLQDSVKNQEQILKNQKESLELQERLLEYGNALERTMGEFYKSSLEQQEIINLFLSSLNNLQSWLLGELSLFDTLVFYIGFSLFIMFFTSVSRTNNARLTMLTILSVNFLIERLICYLMSRRFPDNIKDVHNDYSFYIWISRYICMSINLAILILTAIIYKDVNLLNNKLLTDIHNKIITLSDKIDDLQSKSKKYLTESNISYISECPKSPENNVMEYLDSIKSNIKKEVEDKSNIDTVNQRYLSHSNKFEDSNYGNSIILNERSISRVSGREKLNTIRNLNGTKYNLRRKNSTLETNS